MSGVIKLSICMMVKDEEKNLRRCLDALGPLLAKSDVELIIVDTGSTDKTAEIASNYTSKLFFHKWENNFSAMRNITISYAKGDRVFILDADEVVLNAEMLYEIISDERYLPYNTLIAKIKNLSAVKGVSVTVPQQRIFRKDEGFKYEGSVHNQPVCKAPFLNTDIYIEHYGYLFNDLELKEKKFRRTSTLLKEELKKNPGSLYNRYQLARSYEAHDDYQDALREIRIVYSLITKEKKRRIFVFGGYALICIKNNEYEEAVTVCKEGISLQKDYVDLYYFLAESLKKLGRKQEAMEAYQSYVEFYESYSEQPISANCAIEMYCMNDSYMDVALSFIINELIKQRRLKDAIPYAQKMQDKKAMAEVLFLIHLKLKEFAELKELFTQHLDDRSTYNRFTATIEEEKGNLNQENIKKLERLFSIDNDTYSLLNRIRITDGEDVQPLVEKILKQADMNELPDYYADMFLKFDKNPRLLFSYLKRFQKAKIRSFVKRLIDGKIELKDIFETFLLKETVRDSDYNSLKLYIGAAYTMLCNMAGTLDKDEPDIPENYLMIFRTYVDVGIKYIYLLYNSERLRLYYSTFENQEDRFFIALSYAREAVAKGDKKSGIRYFREAVHANPFMSCYMSKYMDELFSGIDTEGSEEKADG